MGNIVRPNVLVNGTVADADDVNQNEDLIYTEFNGRIDDVNISASAAIQGTKLASTPNGVPTLKINDLAVTTAKIADAPNGVSAAKLNTNAVIKDKVKVTISTVALGLIGAEARQQILSASFAPVLPTISNCIPLSTWLHRTGGTPPQSTNIIVVTMYVDNLGAIFFLLARPDSLGGVLDLTGYNLNFAYIPVS